MGVLFKETSLLYPITAGINGTGWTKISDTYGGINIGDGASGSGVLSSKITAISTGIQDMVHTTNCLRRLKNAAKIKLILMTLCFQLM